MYLYFQHFNFPEYNKLDVLINNAGVMEYERRVTLEGIEMNLGVNHMGHFLLTNMLLPKLKVIIFLKINYKYVVFYRYMVKKHIFVVSFIFCYTFNTIRKKLMRFRVFCRKYKFLGLIIFFQFTNFNFISNILGFRS